MQLQPLLAETVTNVGHETTKDALRFDLNVNAEIAIEADESRLELALVNVIRNAAQVAAQNVTVRVQPQSVNRTPGVRIEIDDDGPGLPPGVDSDRLIEPFFSTKIQGEGTGLGLAIVHNVVAEHRGQLCIENRPGGGCRVAIWLPAQMTDVFPSNLTKELNS